MRFTCMYGKKLKQFKSFKYIGITLLVNSAIRYGVRLSQKKVCNGE